MVPAVGQSADRLGKIRDFDKSPLGPLAECEAAPRKACRAESTLQLRLLPRRAGINSVCAPTASQTRLNLHAGDPARPLTQSVFQKSLWDFWNSAILRQNPEGRGDDLIRLRSELQAIQTEDTFPKGEGKEQIILAQPVSDRFTI